MRCLFLFFFVFFFARLFASLFWEKPRKGNFYTRTPKEEEEEEKKGDIRRVTLSLSLKTRSFSEYEFEAHYKLARDIALVSLLNFCFFRALLIRTRRA